MPTSPLWPLLATFSWQELRHQPWRSAAAVLAVMLGVALAFSVHLINASALQEFSQAVRSVQGQPDLSLQAAQGQFDEGLYPRVARHPGSRQASPVLELGALVPQGPGRPAQALRLIGLDPLQVAPLAPDLLPRPDATADRLDVLRPGHLFLNPAAQAAFGTPAGHTLTVLLPDGPVPLRVSGSVAASGPPLAVMDIAALQDLAGLGGRLSRIDLRLAEGLDRTRYLAELALPAGVQAVEPADTEQRARQLSSAYRVNLTVLALVALFTGAFLVYAVLSLSVARRQRQLALLGVLGLAPGQRLRLVLLESVVLGALGSGLGLALGTGLAALALRWLGGDLGGGYFAGTRPALQWSGAAALVYGALGTLAALAGGWWPARQAGQGAVAAQLKGLGPSLAGRTHGALGGGLLLAGGALALLPPVAGLPLGAYASVACLLLGGIVALPAALAWAYAPLVQACQHRWLPLMATERARRQPGTAATVVSGVVASLSLSVALTVMVASFRQSVTDWLDRVLPAPAYLRLAQASPGPAPGPLTPALSAQLSALPGVARSSGLRLRPLSLQPARPPVMLLARPLEPGGRNLPLVGPVAPVPEQAIAVYVSEACADLYQLVPGQSFDLLSAAFWPESSTRRTTDASFFIAGIWRDYARQSGSIAIDLGDYRRLTGDLSLNDLALWPEPGQDSAPWLDRLRQAAGPLAPAGTAWDITSAAALREQSLRIFDRSFAVTYWLQAVAIGIGLFGVAASFSAQVLARRKEFGLLAHLGLSRRQILALVATEGGAWSLAGSLAGLGLGGLVSVVLVHVVNPQSFHWTMELAWPWSRLLPLCAATLAAGTLTAWFAGQAAASHDAVQAVREDW